MKETVNVVDFGEGGGERERRYIKKRVTSHFVERQEVTVLYQQRQSVTQGNA